MISRISPKLLVLNLMMIYFQMVISRVIMPPVRGHMKLDWLEGSGYNDYETISGPHYDDDASSGWESSGDDLDYLPLLPSDFCVFPGLEPRLSGSRIHLSTSFEELCGLSIDLETRKRCLTAICQCFSAGRNYSIHFEKHFSIECIATTNSGGVGRDRGPFIYRKDHSTLSPSSNSRHSSTSYDDDDDDGDDDEDVGEYIVEIDTTRVTELERSPGGHESIMSKTGLLASIMGGTIIGLLCAVLLAMFIVYRVKKHRAINPDRHHHPKSPQCPPLKGYTKNFDDSDYYA